jgi:hypothetical protein
VVIDVGAGGQGGQGGDWSNPGVDGAINQTLTVE